MYGLGEGDGLGDAWGLGEGEGEGLGDGVALGEGEGEGLGDGLALGDGDGLDAGGGLARPMLGNCVGLGDGDGLGEGEKSQTKSSISKVATALICSHTSALMLVSGCSPRMQTCCHLAVVAVVAFWASTMLAGLPPVF